MFFLYLVNSLVHSICRNVGQGRHLPDHCFLYHSGDHVPYFGELCLHSWLHSIIPHVFHGLDQIRVVQACRCFRIVDDNSLVGKADTAGY